MEKERNEEQAIQLLRLQTIERKRKDGTLITNDRVFWFICVLTTESDVAFSQRFSGFFCTAIRNLFKKFVILRLLNIFLLFPTVFKGKTN
jgi:hypothetical protein